MRCCLTAQRAPKRTLAPKRINADSDLYDCLLMSLSVSFGHAEAASAV